MYLQVEADEDDSSQPSEKARATQAHPAQSNSSTNSVFTPPARLTNIHGSARVANGLIGTVCHVVFARYVANATPRTSLVITSINIQEKRVSKIKCSNWKLLSPPSHSLRSLNIIIYIYI